MSPWRSLLLLLLLATLVSAQSNTSDVIPSDGQEDGPEKNFGDQCDPTLKGYNQALKYFDNCNSQMLACNSATRTCVWKTCANVDYLKHWLLEKNPKVPQRCPPLTQFCPDDGSACQDLLAPGAICQYQRDDECSPANGGICMNSTCYVKAVQIGGACGVDFQQYNYAYGAGDVQMVQQTIYRDNCTVGLTCDLDTHTCKLGSVLGATCTQDRDCASGSCSSGPGKTNGFCVQPPDTYNKLKTWQWVAIGSGVFTFILLTLLLLFGLHRFQRRREQARIAAFFGAQDDLKREIGYRDSDARSTIVLATPQPDFKRRSANSSQLGSGDLHFLKSASTNASMMSFQSEGNPGRVVSSSFDPLTGLTHAENVKLQYQQEVQSLPPGGNGEGSSFIPLIMAPSSSSSNRKSHPLMNATSAPGFNGQ